MAFIDFCRHKSPIAGLVIGVMAVAACQSARRAEVVPAAVAPPVIDNPKTSGPPQTAVLAAGCFWGVQGVFEHARGVKQAISGYAGGERATAQYEVVSSGTTGHAESVKITFDPAHISYGQILQIAFSVVHDPTQLNRQGPDSGTQYRSAIFYADENQKRIAEAYIRQLDRSHVFPRAIVTRVDPLGGFYRAEAYHQDYVIHNPSSSYVASFDMPKIEEFKRALPELYSNRPVMTNGR